MSVLDDDLVIFNAMEYSALEMGKRIRNRERQKDTEIDRLVLKVISFKGEA